MKRIDGYKVSKVVLAPVVAGSLALAGCSGSDDKAERVSANTVPAQTNVTVNNSLPVPSVLPNTGGGISFRFDDLGGGSPIINTYPGVSTEAADRVPNGTYEDGGAVLVDCATTGRTVHSHPEDGEKQRSSDKWIKIANLKSVVRFATLTYGTTNVPFNKIPKC